MKNTLIARFFFLILTLHLNSSYAYEAWVTDIQAKSVSIIDTETNTVIDSIDVSSTSFDIAFSPDGSLAYVSLSDSVAVIDAKTRKVIKTINGFKDPAGLAAVTTSKGLNVFVCDTYNSNIVVINEANKIVKTIHVAGYPLEIVITPDGQKGYILSIESEVSIVGGSVYVIDIPSQTVRNSPIGGLTAFPTSIGISPDGSTVCVGTIGPLLFIDTTHDTVSGSVPLFFSTGNTEIAFLPGTTIGYGAVAGNVIPLFDWALMSSKASILIEDNNRELGGIAITPNGLNLYATINNSQVAVINPPITDTGIRISVGSQPFLIRIRPQPSLSLALSGNRIKNDFGITHEFFNALDWSISSNSDVAFYCLYRDKELIATLDSFKTSFQDHNRPKNTTFNYSIVAFDINHDQIASSNEVRI